MTVLEVRRDDLAQARVADEPRVALADGEALLAVERFGLTANVITYGVAGDTLGYWRFFPASEDGWGRIPAWGFAEVVASASEALDEGERLFGYVPMATHVLLTPQARGPLVLDRTRHRVELPSAYNAYRRAPERPSDGDARELVLRPLFLLCFLLADELEATERSGAEQVLVSSASSKTALGLAHELGASGAKVVGLTSPRNLEFVRSRGIYDEVVPYAELASLDPGVATVAVDMAGDAALRRRIHAHFGDALRRSVLVGATHASAASFAPDPGLPGPEPALFFVPERLRARSREWGPAMLEARVERAFASFCAWTEDWLGIDEARGADDVLAAYRAVLAGEVPPDVARVASL